MNASNERGDNDKEAEKETLARSLRALERTLENVLFLREEMVSRQERSCQHLQYMVIYHLNVKVTLDLAKTEIIGFL